MIVDRERLWVGAIKTLKNAGQLSIIDNLNLIWFETLCKI
jgi:hypothetical protein